MAHARALLLIGVLAIAHYLGTFLLLLLTFGAVRHSFDTGAEPSLFPRIAFPLLTVLQPLAALPPAQYGGPVNAGWAADSLIWAVAIYLAALGLRRVWRRAG